MTRADHIGNLTRDYLLGDRGAAEDAPALHHADRLAALGQVRRSHQAVVPAPDHHGVVTVVDGGNA